jgi:hypothetical protein
MSAGALLHHLASYLQASPRHIPSGFEAINLQYAFVSERLAFVPRMLTAQSVQNAAAMLEKFAITPAFSS